MTAVEWLFEQLCSEKLSWNKDSNGKLFFDNITSDILQQAKKMEKQHLYNFYMQGGVDAITEADRNVEQYYNETFKSE